MGCQSKASSSADERRLRKRANFPRLRVWEKACTMTDKLPPNGSVAMSYPVKFF
jgi:hypothetical protein